MEPTLRTDDISRRSSTASKYNIYKSSRRKRMRTFLGVTPIDLYKFKSFFKEPGRQIGGSCALGRLAAAGRSCSPDHSGRTGEATGGKCHRFSKRQNRDETRNR